MIHQLTPNLAVDRVEPSAEFFKKVGFEQTVEVPEGDHLGFAILVHGHNQVMLQTRTSIREDSNAFLDAADAGPALLYVTVPDLDTVVAALSDYPIDMQERETFYGAREVGYREPGGHIVTFAEFPDPA